MDDEVKEWDGDGEVFSDPEERRCLYSVLDSLR